MNKEMTGIVVFFDKKKGWGFVKPDDSDKDIFVHYAHIQMEGFKTLEQDQTVKFELGQNDKGVCATNVVVID